MKAISLTQPMAWAIFNGKDVENRRWATRYRGPLLIHASRSFDREHYNWIAQKENRLGLTLPQPEEFVHGALLGVVNLVVVVKRGEPFQLTALRRSGRDTLRQAERVVGSRWFFGPYGYGLEGAREFPEPIPYRGALSLFEVPDEIVKEVIAL